MIAGTATAIDVAALGQVVRSTTVPGGIYNAANTAVGTTAVAQTEVLTRITLDVLAAEQNMATANIPGAKVWIMNSSEYLMLNHARDGVGQYAFREELSRGTFSGHRVVVSNNQPVTNVGLVAESQLIMGRKGGPEISTSSDATINASTAPVADLVGGPPVDPVSSMFQLRQLAIRCVWDLDYILRHDAASFELTAVDWD